MEHNGPGQNKMTKKIKHSRNHESVVTEATPEHDETSSTSFMFSNNSRTISSSQNNGRIYGGRRGGRNFQNSMQRDQNRSKCQNAPNSCSSSSTHQVARSSAALRGRGRGNKSKYRGSFHVQDGPLTSDTYVDRNVDQVVEQSRSSIIGRRLNIDAPPFIPRCNNNSDPHKIIRERGMLQPQSTQHTKHRFKRIHREDEDKSLRERLIYQLENESYECAICCQAILGKQGVWTCKTCYHMFHISGGCIVNWAKKSKEDDNKWRCPTCQTKYENIPYNYYCFCGKQRNPVFNFGDIPHSCGSVCYGVRGLGCPHPCSEPCHPGPCPECPVMITKKCNCGLSQKAIRCGSAVEVKCENVCNRLLSCKQHRCVAICHSGPCTPCDVTVKQVCYCGASSREILCSEISENDAYSCDKTCSGLYNCGVHSCERRCHPLNGKDCGRCPTSTDRITHCPCGSNSLEKLGLIRQSCTDSIPTCRNICDKLLKCGSIEKQHRCRSQCHTGPCPPCNYNTSIVCRCKQEKISISCSEYLKYADGEEFLCRRRCRKKKSCGIHKCQNFCCAQDSHYCLQVCGKRLSCGLHLCENICHAGQCPRCLNASFDEQFCHCGKTVRSPPIPCGSRLPECDELCARPHSCSHPVNHRCHGDLSCPPCTFLVDRHCYGMHEIRKNIPCHIDSVSCGRTCNKQLYCGVHKCIRKCHSGECLAEGDKCTRPCPIVRKLCEHPCALSCHSKEECPESICKYLMDITCECGRKKSRMRCFEFKKMMAKLLAVKTEDAVELGNSSGTSGAVLTRSASMDKLNCLSCDDDCKKAARNKKLAKALNIVTNEDGDTETELTITFSEYLKNEYKSSPQFVIDVEKVFLALLENIAELTNLSCSTAHNFRPMPMERRRFIHEYASYFNIETISVDEVPKRSVIATVKRGVSKAPLILLTSLSKYPRALSTPGPVTLRSNINEEIKQRAAVEISLEEGTTMKSLKSDRWVHKRVAPQIKTAEPLQQYNVFDVLGSDNEDPLVETASECRVPESISSNNSQAYHGWWSDEETSVDKNIVTVQNNHVLPLSS